jgi:hypothetical protein
MNGSVRSWTVRAGSVLGSRWRGRRGAVRRHRTGGEGVSLKVCNDAATQSYFSLDQAPHNGFASYIVNAGEWRTFNYGVHPGG